MNNDPVALIIVDMQRCMKGFAAGIRNNPDAERNIQRLSEGWRSAAWPVIHVRHMSRSPSSPFWPGQPGVEFQTELTPLDNEHVVEKNVPDAFIHTGLEHWLHVRGIRQLVIVGVSTNISVESTARTAGNLGFEVAVVSDATYAFQKKDYAGVLRSADEVHAMSLANLDGEYATVITSADALIMPRVGT